MTDLDAPSPPPAPPAPRAVADADEAGKGHPARLAVLAGLLAFLTLRGGWPLLTVIIGVVVMITLHELGHYLTARWGGMKVTEFFIGFGPKIWSFQHGETEYGIKAIPAGAYVKVIGMNSLDEVDPADEGRTYRQASYPRRMAVAVAGSTMHFLQAILLLFVMYAFVGVPGGSLTEDKEWRVVEVQPGSAADNADIQPGDRIETVDGVAHPTFTDFAMAIADRPGDDVVLDVVRDGQHVPVNLRVGRSEVDPTRGLLGIRRELVTTTVGPVHAVGAAVGDFADQSRETIAFIGRFFTPSGIGNFASDVASGRDDSAPVPSSGPATSGGETQDEGRIISIVGAVRIGADLTETGILGFLLFFVGINITIGIINLLPVLPLDGGHVVVATYERFRELRRPRGERYLVDMTRLLPVVYAVFTMLIMLGVTSIYLDIVDPVSL